MIIAPDKNRNAGKLVAGYCVAGLSSKASGLVTLIEGFAGGLGALETRVQCYAINCKAAGFSDLNISPPNRLVRVPGIWMKRLNWSPALKGLLQRECSQLDIFHNHTMWCLPNHYASSIAASAGLPMVYSSHGTLEPWSMARSRFRKLLIWHAFQERDLVRANCIHVSARNEIANVRRMGVDSPIAVIPNGVEIPSRNALSQDVKFRDAVPGSRGRKILLFLGRLHEKKGLAPLIKAWRKLASEFPDWHLVVAGPDDGFRNQVEKMIREFELSSSVTLTGSLLGDDKAGALSASDVFVLPSFAEGFSLAVLEAMAYGLPVVLSEQCNFPEVEPRMAGLIISANESSTYKGLREILELDARDRIAMGANARNFVENEYSWAVVSEKMQDLYKWLVEGGDRPSSFEMDLVSQ